MKHKVTIFKHNEPVEVLMTAKEALDLWKKRDTSWSQLNSWTYSKDQWFNSYILGNRFNANAGMKFGNTVGDTLGLGRKKSLVPKLEKYLKGEKEHSLRVKMNDHTLVGFCDHYCPVKKILNENKTSQNVNRWNQVEVDKHGQLTMYALLIMLRDGTAPDDLDIFLNFIPVANREFGGMHIPDPNEFYRFQTTRTVAQCLQFGGWIEQELKKMEEYAIKELS